MIHYVTGNLFESSASALVNTVNTVGVMGKGLALQFKEEFPENFRIYKKVCKDKQLDVGQMLITQDHSPRYGRKTIVNFPTKRHWRNPSEYVYISQGLEALKSEIQQRRIKSIAIPALGSHNGGLDWPKVKEMILDALSHIDCDIYIYEPTHEIFDKMKTERVRWTPARAMLLVLLADMNRIGEFASVFASEKIIYFMQRLGATDTFRIDFKPYIYGPYSGGKVAHVLYYLNGSYIMGMTALQNRPFDFIWLTEDAEKEAVDYLESSGNPLYLDICGKAKSLLRTYYSNYSLELLSSVDYILDHLDLDKDWKLMEPDFIQTAVMEQLHKWSSRKGRIFKSEFVAKAIDHLRRNDTLFPIHSKL